MKWSLALIIMVLFTLNGICQDSSTELTYKNQLKVTPLKLFDLVNPGIELGYERFVAENVSMEVSYAHLLSRKTPGGTFDLGIKGKKVGLEIKHFLGNSKSRQKYVGIEVVRLTNAYTDIGRFGISSFDDTLNLNYTDTFSIKKNTLSVNLKVGIRYLIGHFVIELYSGLGIKYKEVIHSDRRRPQDPLEVPIHPNIYHIANMEGTHWGLNIPLNMKIGIRF